MTFINRIHELSVMTESFKQSQDADSGQIFNIALLGLRRTGKTSLVKHFINTQQITDKKIYLDISRISSSPQYFASEIVKKILQIQSNSEEEDILDLAQLLNDFDIFKSVRYFKETVLISKDNVEIITFSLEFFSKFKNTKWILALDEFQDITTLDNFKGVDIDKLFRSALQLNTNVFYIISGSYPNLIKRWIQNPDKLLFGHFKIITIDAFTKEHSFALIESLADSNFNNKEKEEIFQYAYGNPYLIKIIVGTATHSPLTIEDVFKNELFHSEGKIYGFFNYLLTSSLSKLSGKGIVQDVIRTIAISDTELLASEIAKALNRENAVIHIALKELVKVDLIYVHEKKYIFQNLPFKFFLKYKYLGIEAYEYEKNKHYQSSVSKLLEQYSGLAQELGVTKEKELFNLVKDSQGKTLEGIDIPEFKSIELNVLINGEEIDLLCKTHKDEVWVFELKWRNKKVGDKEVKKFEKKYKANRYIFISKSGYTDLAIDYSNSKKIALLSGEIFK